MNDLAEKALHGIDAGRRQVRDHPASAFAVAGFALSVAVVVAGGAVGAAGSTRPLTAWLGLQDTHRASRDAVQGAAMLAAVAGLVALWLVVLRFVQRHPWTSRRIWAVAGAWAAPFALGPPLADTSVYSSAAYGLLQRAGHNPYATAPVQLGTMPVVAAVDPGSRGTPSAIGPLGSLVQHLAVSVGNGSALGAVIVLRVLCVLALVVIGRLAGDLAGPRRDRVLALTLLNPLALLYLVSAAHLDALMIALVLAGLLAARRRRWPAAIAWLALAGSVSGQALVVLPAVVLVHCARRRAGSWLPIAVRDLAIAAAIVGGIGLATPHGFGWVTSVSRQFSGHTPFSVAGAISAVLAPVVPGASYDDLAVGGRATVLIAMVCVAGYLLATATRRPLDRTAAYLLLTVALLAPALYAWYLLWGVVCLAVRAGRPQTIAVVTLSAAGCVLSPAGFTPLTRDVLTAVLLAAVAAGATILSVAARRSGRHVPAPS